MKSRVSHLILDLVDLDLDVPAPCPTAQLILPIVPSAQVELTDSGTCKITVEPTYRSQYQMGHPVHHFIFVK